MEAGALAHHAFARYCRRRIRRATLVGAYLHTSVDACTQRHGFGAFPANAIDELRLSRHSEVADELPAHGPWRLCIRTGMSATGARRLDIRTGTSVAGPRLARDFTATSDCNQ
jgi:hypothetical protein